MDILSAVSGIITLLGAGGTIVSGLERLSSLREAPNTVFALNNEVSDFRFVILELLNILQHESTRPSTSQAFSQNLDSVLRRARDKLVELECLIEYRLLVPHSGNEIRLNKTAWVLERHKVKRIQEEIRSIRTNLITMLGVLNCNSTSRLQIQLGDLRLLGNETQEQLGEAFARTELNLHAMGGQLTVLQAQSEASLQLRDRAHTPIRQSREPSQHQAEPSLRQARALTDNDMLPNTHNFPSMFALSISSMIQRRTLVCMPTCTCRCHRPHSWKSPLWLQSLLGLLFTGYVGLPMVSPPCDGTLCQYRSEPTVTVQYYFPSWFAHGMISLYVQISKHNGLTHSLRISRVIWNGSKILTKSFSGDVDGVKAILASRQGSPFDMGENGITALGVNVLTYASHDGRGLQLFSTPSSAVMQASVEHCFKLERIHSMKTEQASKGYKSNFKSSVANKVIVCPRPMINFAWSRILGKTYDEDKSQAMQAIIPVYELADFALTPLHLAVLGLSSDSLEEALRHCSSLTVDAVDAFHYTALWWAVRRDDYQAIKLLLQHHADPYGGDDAVPPIYSAFGGCAMRCLGLLLKYGTDINRRSRYGTTPLITLAYGSINGGNNLDMLNLLLQYSPDLNLRGPDGDSALLIAIENQNYDVAARLIQVGADIHIKENSGYNALSIAILFNRHPIIHSLLEHQADHHGIIKQHGTLLHLVAEMADIKTLELLTNSALATRDVQIKRSGGQTAIEVAKARKDTTVEWQNTFYAFIWSVDKTKTRVSPFVFRSRTDQERVRAEDSDGEGDVFHDVQE